MGVACSICGRRPGVKELRVSEKFVSYPELYHGSLVCDVCSRLFEDRRLRSSSWVLVGDDFKVFGDGDKEGLLEFLRDPPEGSIIYVKSGGRRYGFLKCMRFTSTRSRVVLCGEDEGPVIIPRERLAYLLDLAAGLYKKLRKKAPLLEGCLPHEWVHEEECRRIEEVRGDPAWGIVVRAL